MALITRDNVDSLLDRGEIYAAINNGRWYRIRRNGATLKWKRDATRVKIPFKYGLHGYGAITEADFQGNVLGLGGSLNFDHYRHVSDVPVNLRPY